MKALDLLEHKLSNSHYEKIARRFYQAHHQTNSLYIEVMPEGIILFYDGWDYKRGLQNSRKVEQSEFAVEHFESDRWRSELASAICFARRARNHYGWNVIPVFNGYEIDVKKHHLAFK